MTKPIQNRVKELRKQAGLTQQELADQLGVIRKTISNWERGTNRISPEHTENLARFFSSVGWILIRREFRSQSKFRFRSLCSLSS